MATRTPTREPFDLAKLLADRTAIITFAMTYVTLSSPIWGLFIAYLITGASLLKDIAFAIFAFWANPLAPFIAVCFLISTPIAAAIRRRRSRR